MADFIGSFKGSSLGASEKNLLNPKLSIAAKRANKNKYYKVNAKQVIIELTKHSSTCKDEMVTNYNLYNSIIDGADFKHLTEPYGIKTSIALKNKDILSPKIKAVQGIEASIPFDWQVISTNPYISNKKQELKRSLIKERIVQEAAESFLLEQKVAEATQAKGAELSALELTEIKTAVAPSAVPLDRIDRELSTKGKHPYEKLYATIIKDAKYSRDASTKFNEGIKHACIAGREIYLVDVINGKPDFMTINPMTVNVQLSENNPYIHYAQKICVEYKMHRHEIISQFGLSNTDIRKVIDGSSGRIGFNEDNYYGHLNFDEVSEADVSRFMSETTGTNDSTYSVFHVLWRANKKFGILYFGDPNSPSKTVVDEEYKLNPSAGDIKIEYDYLSNQEEALYVPRLDMWLHTGDVKGQYVDITNLKEIKPFKYVGVLHDADNSASTSLMSRGLSYQYTYTAISHRLEEKMYNDLGNLLAISHARLADAGVDGVQGLGKVLHYAKVNSLLTLDDSLDDVPNPDGITKMVKSIDASSIKDLNLWINYLEFIDKQCSNALGVTPELLGAIRERSSTSNVNSAIAGSSNVLSPLLQMHNICKKEVLDTYLKLFLIHAKETDVSELEFMLDNREMVVFNIDKDALLPDRVKVYITNDTDALEIRNTLLELSHAAMQNGSATLLDVAKIFRTKDASQAEELLAEAEQKAHARNKEVEQIASRRQEAADKALQDRIDQEHKNDIEKINVEYDRKDSLETKKQLILSAGFNEDKDFDNDGQLDILEMAKHGVNAKVALAKIRQEDKKIDIKDKEVNAKIAESKKKDSK